MLKSKKAFTLIELLVVIAIIALLLSIIMPALRKAKDYAKRIHCSANLRSLTTAALMYADNNNGRTPSSTNIWYDPPSSNPQSPTGTPKPGWCGRTVDAALHLLPIDNQINGTSDPVTGLVRGQLWPYIESPDAWRCPADPVKENMRSYCMGPQWWGAYADIDDDSVYYTPGTAGLVYWQISKCRNPGGRLMFMDQLGLSHDAYFAISNSTQGLRGWWNIPGVMHSGGSVNGFADGHVESYRLGSQTAALAKQSLESSMDEWLRTGYSDFKMLNGDFDVEDLIFYQRASWGKIGR